jgi:hypothetical protein
MMEVGPWRWDGKSEHDWFVKEGGWEEYTTVVFSVYPGTLSQCSWLMYIRSRPTCRDWIFLYEYRQICSYYRRGRTACFPSDANANLLTITQAQKNIIEFLRNWYKVFPEYKHVDVSALCFIYTTEPLKKVESRHTLLERALLVNGYLTTVRATNLTAFHGRTN